MLPLLQLLQCICWYGDVGRFVQSITRDHTDSRRGDVVVVVIVEMHLLVRGRGQDWTVNDNESHGFETGRCCRCCNCCNAPAGTGTWARLDSQ